MDTRATIESSKSAPAGAAAQAVPQRLTGLRGAMARHGVHALLLAGAALRLSWQAAGLLMQGFFLGNMLPMTAVVGQLYIDSPLRLCNAYLLDDQIRLGTWLIAVAALLALGWLAHVAWQMSAGPGGIPRHLEDPIESDGH